MKKSLHFLSFLVFGLLSFLLLQSSYAQKSDIEYDFRIYTQSAPVHNFDILHYRFDWDMNFNTNYLQGKAIIQACSLSSDLNTITLHLDDVMQVTQITEDQALLAFSHHDDLLEIYRYQSG